MVFVEKSIQMLEKYQSVGDIPKEWNCQTCILISDLLQCNASNMWPSIVMKENNKPMLNSKSMTFFIFCLVWFYGTSTFVGYLKPIPFLCK